MKNKREILIFGAGAIGRGFLAPKFFKKNYSISFVDNNEDLEEDIPFKEDWVRISVESIKQSICNWIEDNLEHESEENYDIYSKEDERRLYVKIHQDNSEDEEDETEHYYCIFEKHDTRKVEMTDVKF